MPLKDLLWDIVRYMRENPGADIISSDDPAHGMVGWISTYDSRTWRLSLTELQRFFATDEGDRFRRTFGSAQGRKDVVASLWYLASTDGTPRADASESNKQAADLIGNPPPVEPPPPPRNRFQIMDDD